MSDKRIYLDYASTTPVDSRVLKAMQPYFAEKFGNPGSIHSFGQEAIAAVDKSRETIAKAIGAKFDEIVFTSSATEANNLALRGVASQLKTKNLKLVPRIVVSAIEHESILETAKDLEKQGVEVIYIPVDKNGLIDLKKLEKSLTKNTVLVSIIYANNEIGVIQDIPKIAKIIRNSKDTNKLSGVMINHNTASYPLLHTDATQAFQYLDCNVDKLGVDLMTISSHKIYGPKGAGALYIRGQGDLNTRNLELKTILTGGGQEFGMRSGTENVPAIVGFASAVEIAAQNRNKEAKRVQALRDYFFGRLRKTYPKIELNGDAKNRLPNNLNIYFNGFAAEQLIIKLDLAGVAVSAGSACTARSLEPSYVLNALGYPNARAKSSLRITLGRLTTKKELDKVLTILTEVLK